MSKKRVEQIVRKFRQDMQKIVDSKGGGIDSISIGIGDEPMIKIAEKKKPKHGGK